MRFNPIAMLLTLIVVSTPAVSMENTSDLSNSESPSAINSLNSTQAVDDRIAIVNQHIATDVIPPMILVKYMIHANNGEQFEYWKYDGGRAFQIACEYYAMYTLDFDVSVGELVAAGFWPYDFFPEDMKYDLRFHTDLEDADLLVTNSLNPEMLRQSEQEYLLGAKSDILRWFHKCYFFETEQQRDISVNELADHRMAAFWNNPISEKSMEERPGLGDYQLHDLMKYASDFEKLAFDYNTMIPVVNQHSTFAISKPDNHNLDTPESLVGIYQRVFDAHYGKWPIIKTYNVVFPNADDASNPFVLTWQVTSNAYFASSYQLVRYVPADDPGPLSAGEILIRAGRRAPDTIYSWTGNYVFIISDAFPEYAATSRNLTQDQNEHLNLITCLTSILDGGTATTPGPVCE